MKTLIALIAYTFVSGVLGFIVCGLLLWKKNQRAAKIAALLFFGGPLFAYGYVSVRDTQRLNEYEATRAEVQELCTKYGGDKIYKTVENVEGVFQMKARPEPYLQWKDQYGMVDPWGAALGDREEMHIVSTHGRGYWFFEQQLPYGEKEENSYRRHYLVSTGKKVGDVYIAGDYKEDPLLEPHTKSVEKLRSRYGYLAEDISTPEMRKKWIAGGKVKIFDLQTNELLAERTGYFMALGADYPSPWTKQAGDMDGSFCPANGDLHGFLFSVLKPIQQFPTADQLKALAEE